MAALQNKVPKHGGNPLKNANISSGRYFPSNKPNKKRRQLQNHRDTCTPQSHHPWPRGFSRWSSASLRTLPTSWADGNFRRDPRVRGSERFRPLALRLRTPRTWRECFKDAETRTGPARVSGGSLRLGSLTPGPEGPGALRVAGERHTTQTKSPGRSSNKRGVSFWRRTPSGWVNGKPKGNRPIWNPRQTRDSLDLRISLKLRNVSTRRLNANRLCQAQNKETHQMWSIFSPPGRSGAGKPLEPNC